MRKFLRNNWLLLLAIVYIINPFDLIPINPLDDALILAFERIITSRLNKSKEEKAVKKD